MPNPLTPPNPDSEHYPTVTLAGFCQLLLSRMAEATMNPADEDFADFAKGLVRLVSGWACERGVHADELRLSVSDGERDCREHAAHSEPIEIPVQTTEH